MEKKKKLIVSILPIAYVGFCLLFQLVCFLNTGSCGSHLKGIGSCFSVYCYDNNGEYPQVLPEFVKSSGLASEVLSCPSDSNTLEESYFYRGKDVNNKMPGSMILIYEKNANHRYASDASLLQKTGHLLTFNFFCPKIRNVLLNDLTVRTFAQSKFNEAIKKDNENRVSLELSEMPLD